MFCSVFVSAKELKERGFKFFKLLVVIRLLFSRVSLVQFIMILLGSLERDYSLFRGVITLEKGSRSQHGRYGWIATTSKLTPSNPDNLA